MRLDTAGTSPSDSKLGHAGRAYRSLRAWVLLLAVLVAGLIADLGSKGFAFREVPIHRETVLANPNWMPPPHEPVKALPWGLLEINLVVNRGAVFGIASDQRTFFIAFTLTALTIGLLAFGRWTTVRDRMAHVAIGCVLAGGIGNLYDRVMFGVVRDFLHMLPHYRLPLDWRWPGGSPEAFPWVFNVADMLLLVGMVMLMLHTNALERRRKAARIVIVRDDVALPADA